MRYARRWLAERAATTACLLVVVLLAVPVVYTAVFSLNDYRRSNLIWNSEGSPTLAHWADPCGPVGLCSSVAVSLRVGVLSAALATVLGTLMAYALARASFRGRSAIEVLVLLPLATPDVVLAVGLLSVFVQGWSDLGLRLGEGTLVASHALLSLSFVVVAVRARLEGIGSLLTEAAADLYASPKGVFRWVTWPLAAPGIAGAALLAFAVSLDDVVVATFVGGDAMSFPRYVYVSALRGVPAEANVVGLILAGAAVLFGLVYGMTTRNRR